MPDLSGFPGLEVLIGLSFVFFLLSTVCSAVQEALSNALGWRAKTLEDAVGNLLGNPKVRRGVKEWFGRVDRNVDQQAAELHAQAGWPDDMTAEVFAHWRIQGLVRDPASSLRRRSRPSYLPPRALSLAVAETLARHATPAGAAAPNPAAATPWEHTDDVIFAAVQETLARVPLEHPRAVLQKAAVNADGDLERFRAGVETAFNDAMQRASGWYKRKAQIVLAIIAVVVAIGLNVDAGRIASRLYRDDAVRTAVVAKAGAERDSQSAAQAVTAVRQLNLPIGWGAGNVPAHTSGWLGAIAGWLLTIAALSLGAPFWYDLLGRITRKPAAAGATHAPAPRPPSDIDAVRGAKPAPPAEPPPAP